MITGQGYVISIALGKLETQNQLLSTVIAFTIHIETIGYQ